MRHPERNAYLDSLRELDDREYADHLAVNRAWAGALCVADPEDPTPAPAAVKAAAEEELERLKGLNDQS